MIGMRGDVPRDTNVYGLGWHNKCHFSLCVRPFGEVRYNRHDPYALCETVDSSRVPCVESAIATAMAALSRILVIYRMKAEGESLAKIGSSQYIIEGE